MSVAAVLLLGIALLGLLLVVSGSGPAPRVAEIPSSITEAPINAQRSAASEPSDIASHSDSLRGKTRDTDASSLKQEISATEGRLRETETEISKYGGGLIKTLLESTAAIQRQTLEMLRQRDRSWTFGIGLRYTVDGKEFEPPGDSEAMLVQLEREIAETARSIRKNEADAVKYSGGLIRATTLAAAATARQTLAMLEQRRVALRFGLPQYVGFQNENARSEQPATAIPNLSDISEPLAREWEIVEIDSRVTERNNSWWRYAWKLTLRNTGASPRRFSATIEFQDKGGFVIDSGRASDLVLSGGEQKSFTGYTLVSVPGARDVERTVAKVQER